MGLRRRRKIPGSPRLRRRGPPNALIRLLSALRRRSASGDRIRPPAAGFADGYAPLRVLISGHRDARLSPRGRFIWWTVLAAVVIGGVVSIALTR